MEIKDKEKLTEAFDHMVETVSDSIHNAEETLAPTVEEMVHNAQLLARDIYALSQEEAESLGRTLKRDMEKANRVLNKQRKELRDWLSYDFTIVEDRFIDLIARSADKTWLDFRAFETEDHQGSVYSSGEVCNAGTLSCKRCEHRVRLSRSGQIPECPECGHREFFRVIG